MFFSLDFWKYHKKYDKTNSFVAIYDKSWHACCVVNDTELQNNLCRFVEGMTPIFSQSAWYCTWHLIQVILLPWFIGILNLSSNYTLKKPFKLFQNFCFFQLYYCVVLTVDNFNILSKVLLLFFSVGSVFQVTKMQIGFLKWGLALAAVKNFFLILLICLHFVLVGFLSS